MYTICHTKSDDVKAALAEMKKRSFTCDLFQVGQKLYKRMEKNQDDVLDLVSDKNRMFTININTGMVHKSTCSRKGKKTISAYLVRPKDAGLPLCQVCMKQ